MPDDLPPVTRNTALAVCGAVLAHRAAELLRKPGGNPDQRRLRRELAAGLSRQAEALLAHARARRDPAHRFDRLRGEGLPADLLGMLAAVCRGEEEQMGPLRACLLEDGWTRERVQALSARDCAAMVVAVLEGPDGPGR